MTGQNKQYYSTCIITTLSFLHPTGLPYVPIHSASDAFTTKSSFCQADLLPISSSSPTTIFSLFFRFYFGLALDHGILQINIEKLIWASLAFHLHSDILILSDLQAHCDCFICHLYDRIAILCSTDSFMATFVSA